MREVLRLRAFRLLLGGLLASMAADSLLVLVLAIWVKDLTGSTSLAGLTIFAVAVSMTMAPLVGWLVDRFRRRRFLVVANLLVALALTPLLAVHGRDDVWLVFVVACLYGLSTIAISAALNGLVKELVPPMHLVDANGALQSLKQGLRIGGPLVGAALYTAVGGWPLVLLAIGGSLVAAVVIAAIRLDEEPPQRSAEPWLAQVAAGLRHVGGHPVLRRTTIGLASGVLMLGFNESLVFAYVDQGLHRKPGFVGVLAAVQSVGGLLGALAAPRLTRRLGEVGTVGLGMMAFLPLASYSFLLAHLWLAVPCVLAFGFGTSCVVVGFNTVLQASTPQALMGRVSAATDALISGPAAISVALGALCVSLVDYRVLFVVTGTVLLLVGCWVWAGRDVLMQGSTQRSRLTTSSASASPLNSE